MSFEYEDKVTVYWIDGAELTGIIKHIPNDTGDCWYIEDKEGNLQAINSNCSNFERIVKFKELT